MSPKPHNPWRARAARAGLALAIVASGAGALHATPAVPDLPSPSQPASQPPQATSGDTAARPGARPKRPRGKVRTIASGPPATPAGRPDVVAYAMTLRGIPYRWGGDDPAEGFDCSGFSMHVWGKFGVSIPHYTVAIWNSEPRVQGEPQPGDLVFFGMGHMGMYVGGNRFIHAPQTGDVVKVTSMAPGTNYGKRYSGAVRPD